MKLRREQLRLYAVTDRAWLPEAPPVAADGAESEIWREAALLAQIERAIRGGVTMVQLREKELQKEAFEREARAALRLCRSYGVPLLINDDVELAGRIVGVTAKTVDEARAAEKAGADYLGSGAVFGSSTKRDAIPMKLDLFEEICRSVAIPVIAIGGITPDNVDRLAGRGMSGFAAAGGIFAAEDIEGRARLMRKKAERLCVSAEAGGLPDDGEIAFYCEKVREQRPVVQCITNLVTANDCANALLAIGASPTMAHHPDEMEDFAVSSDALVLNMGATESFEAMFRAGKCANFLRGTEAGGHPIVIDPVGCAGSPFRRRKCLDLIEAVRPSCIRGNAAEIRALALDVNTGRGVDGAGSGKNPADGADTAKYAAMLSRRTGAIVVASGAVDYIAQGARVIELHGGSLMLTRITGAGCMQSVLLGAFLSVEESARSAAACCALMAKCGESAAAMTLAGGGGTGTFHIRLLDALSTYLTPCSCS